MIGKYEFLRKRKIISVSEGNRNLHSNQMPCLLTLEELELTDNSGIINIVLENNEEQQVLTINKPKLAPLPKLKFCIINMGNRTIEIDKKDVTNNLRFIVGHCNPIILVPGIFSVKLMTQIDCKGLYENERDNL